jgi:hypothetical protein
MQRTAQETLADGINQLSEANPGVDLFGWRIFTFKITASDIKDPITSYRDLMFAYRKMMGVLPGGAPAHKIPDALGEMQRITLRTKCLYVGTTTEIDLMRDYMELRREAAPWVGVTNASTETVW